MIKIGEMAKLCGVSIQTLRYYDKLDLLRADYVDDATGYRYYGPDKITLFRTIARLKALDFSLDEIKEFLAAAPETRIALYGKKKQELEEQMNRSSEALRRIEAATVYENDSLFPLNEQVLKMPFEDDPRVIGRWEYCGDLPTGRRFSPDAVLERRQISLETLFFLPGGNHVWTYFWTRGILYVLLSDSRLVVPNEYRITEAGGVTYLLLDWMVDKCTTPSAGDCTRVYRQVDTRVYSERETYLFTDDTDLPYVPDERVLGGWEAVDLIALREEFSPHRSAAPQRLAVKEIEFFSRGICTKRLRSLRGGSYSPGYRYTKGKILNARDGIAEEYELCTVEGQDYLIVQHKSRDYSYLGRVFCYYVFKRKVQ